MRCLAEALPDQLGLLVVGAQAESDPLKTWSRRSSI